MPLSSGATFADFAIVRFDGTDPSGEVYEVESQQRRRREMLRILTEDASADVGFKNRLGRDATVAKDLYHPHLVGVCDHGECDGRVWVATDYVDGIDAERMMSGRYRTGLPRRVALDVVAAIAGALDYAHRRGVVHRDVTPANILLTHTATGLSRIVLANLGSARSVTTSLPGSDADGRADQFGLAAATIHLLSGSGPFAHPEPWEGRSELAGLDGVIARALANNPYDRFDTCEGFAVALARTHSPQRRRPTSHSVQTAAASTATGLAGQKPPPVHPSALSSRRTNADARQAGPVVRRSPQGQGQQQHAPPPGGSPRIRSAVGALAAGGPVGPSARVPSGGPPPVQPQGVRPTPVPQQGRPLIRLAMLIPVIAGIAVLGWFGYQYMQRSADPQTQVASDSASPTAVQSPGRPPSPTVTRQPPPSTAGQQPPAAPTVPTQVPLPASPRTDHEPVVGSACQAQDWRPGLYCVLVKAGQRDYYHLWSNSPTVERLPLPAHIPVGLDDISPYVGADLCVRQMEQMSWSWQDCMNAIERAEEYSTFVPQALPPEPSASAEQHEPLTEPGG